MKQSLLIVICLMVFYKFSNGQVVTGSRVDIVDSWDNVVTSSDELRYHAMIGTYRGWDPTAVYVGGLNANVEGYSTEKVVLGNHTISNKFLLLDVLSGNVGIGTTNLTEKLSVNGNIRTKKLIVSQTGWPDYVFNPNYKLLSLSSLEIFIKKNSHLPDVPSSKSVDKEGLDIGANQAALLRKIEELTLYVIEQEKKNQHLQARVQQLERKFKR